MLCEQNRDNPFTASNYTITDRFAGHVSVKLDGTLVLSFEDFTKNYEGKPFCFSNSIKFLLLKDRYYPGYFDLSYLFERYGRLWSIPFYYDDDNNYIAIKSEYEVSEIIVPSFNTIEDIKKQILLGCFIFPLVYCKGKLYKVSDNNFFEYCSVQLSDK